MYITDDVIETVRNMTTPSASSVDEQYTAGYNDAMDAVVEMMEALQEEQNKILRIETI